jgi:hypothetical protein
MRFHREITMKAVFTFLVLLLFPAAAHADILYLENGGKVEGVVTGGPETFVVRSVMGTTRIPANRIVRRVKLPYITEVFEAKRRRVDRKDPDALFELALWCEREGLRREVKPLLREILALDPDHGPTRARQGLVKYAGLWMTPERAHELRMTKEGFVLYEGRWFTPAGLKAYIGAKQEAARLEEMLALKREEREARERKVREEEAARKREEERLRQAEEDREERRRLQRRNDELVDLLRMMHLRDAYSSSWRWRGWGWGGGWVGLPGWGGGGVCPPVAVPYRGHRGFHGFGTTRSRSTGVGTGYRLTGGYTVSPIPTWRR